MRGDLVLAPETAVEWTERGLVALDVEPWLRLEWPVLPKVIGCFVTLTYRASLWDAPARPVLRFWQQDGTFIDRIAAAPVAGSGAWTGRIPPATTRMSISPTNRAGRFDFKIEACRRRSWIRLLVDGMRNRPRSTRSAVLTKLIGWGPEADVNLAWATGATPLSRFSSWLQARTRSPDFDGLDRPRLAWADAPSIMLFVRSTGDIEALRRTLRALQAQVFPCWIAHVADAVAVEDDPRIITPARIEDATLAGAITCALRAGDILSPTALAIVAEQAHREPGTTIFYGDAIIRDAKGAAVPSMHPGWSPRLQQAASYLDDSWIFVRDLNAWPDQARADFLARGTLPTIIVESLPRDTVRPLRRFLGERPVEALARPSIASPTLIAPTPASVAIIIPTRDHPALLSRCLASIRASSRPGNVEIVVVDNGSVAAETLAYFETLRGVSDVRLLSRPGPFNFSLMCNEAAAVASGDILVFLNDDTEILSGDWLDRLCAHALDPKTGAVGAKLTYPDGRIQHIGVLVGMGESAGHFGAMAPASTPGWANRNLVTHEVSAVTGACLAVTRAKFEAVGGFDAIHLPVELSDIDLCLKLNAQGWQTIVDPAISIMHEESVSRGGATLRRLAVYDRERAIFTERWRHVLRDDPTFHPGLSLYSWQPALG